MLNRVLLLLLLKLELLVKQSWIYLGFLVVYPHMERSIYVGLDVPMHADCNAFIMLNSTRIKSKSNRVIFTQK